MADNPFSLNTAQPFLGDPQQQPKDPAEVAQQRGNPFGTSRRPRRNAERMLNMFSPLLEGIEAFDPFNPKR